MSTEAPVIRILTVDDHRLIRQGIAGLVATQSDMRVIAEAGNGREAIKAFREHRPDVTLMDMQMPEMSGLDAIIAIRGVYAGRKAIAPEVSFQLAEHATDDALTAGEVRVLALLAQGMANKEIARSLSVSEATIKGQVRNILSKLGAKDRTHAAMIALKRGIIQQ